MEKITLCFVVGIRLFNHFQWGQILEYNVPLGTIFWPIFPVGQGSHRVCEKGVSTLQNVLQIMPPNNRKIHRCTNDFLAILSTCPYLVTRFRIIFSHFVFFVISGYYNDRKQIRPRGTSKSTAFFFLLLIQFYWDPFRFVQKKFRKRFHFLKFFQRKNSESNSLYLKNSIFF